jgi:hypothetical protein
MDDREFWHRRYRAILAEASAIAERWEIEKPTVYVPGPLHDADEQKLARQFVVIREARPTK